MERGEVYRFNYLWSHEAEKNRVSGSKIRRVCLAMKVNEWLYLFRITSLEPQPQDDGEERMYLEIPPIERQRVGLNQDHPSYLILDDYNRVREDELYDFESTTPEGQFSVLFLQEIARRFQVAIQEKRPMQGLIRR